MPVASAESPLAAFDVAPWSQVSGSDGQEYIADEQGRAMSFRGINVKADHPAEMATDQLMADAEARGFNLLRLAVYWDEMEPTDDVWAEDYFAEIATVMDRAEAHGLWVALDMHQDTFSTAFNGKGIPLWATDDGGLPFEDQGSFLLNYLQPGSMEAWENLYERPDLRAAQVDAWEELVQRFGDRANLLGYDLLNEPFGKMRTGEDLFAAAARVERTQLTPMYQRLTTAIRRLDPKRWVFVEPPNLASLGIATNLGAIEGGNIAFYPHMYDANIEFATYTPGGVQEFDASFFDGYAAVIDVYPDRNRVPVLFGEWGLANPERPGMDEFVRRSLRLMEQHGSGWTVFTGCRGSSYCVWDSQGNDRPAIGQITQPWARSVAGTPQYLHWDPDTRTLYVAFEDSAATGTTDLVVPASRVYPEGWEVVATPGEGAWSSEVTAGVDPDPLVVSISAERGGGDPAGFHLFCLRPEGSTTSCTLPADDGGPVDLVEPPLEPSAPATPAPTPVPASAAQPLPFNPNYTG